MECQLDTLQEESAELVVFRAAKCWQEKGERSNGYFYHCLRNRQKQQYIRALQRPDGSLVSQPLLFIADPIEPEACDSLLVSLLVIVIFRRNLAKRRKRYDEGIPSTYEIGQ